MEIEIIRIPSQQDALDETRKFGIILNKAASKIKMLHWYAENHNVHVILGDLYEDLVDLFDKLQEEIIGTCKQYNVNFPSFNQTLIQLDDIESSKGNENIINHYHAVDNEIKNILTSLEFNNFITSVKSGLNNTKEDIITRFNKSSYLLSMVTPL